MCSYGKKELIVVFNLLVFCFNCFLPVNSGHLYYVAESIVIDSNRILFTSLAHILKLQIHKIPMNPVHNQVRLKNLQEKSTNFFI